LPIPSAITAKGYNPKNRVIAVYSREGSDATGDVNMGLGLQKNLLNDPARAKLISRPDSMVAVGSKKTIEAKALKRFITQHQKALKINVDIVGDPKLQAGKLVEIGGTGSPFTDGKWFIDEVRHVMNANDYICQLALKIPPRTGNNKGKKTVVGVMDSDATGKHKDGDTNYGVGISSGPTINKQQLRKSIRK
jgi:phage protein D